MKMGFRWRIKNSEGGGGSKREIKKCVCERERVCVRVCVYVCVIKGEGENNFTHRAIMGSVEASSKSLSAPPLSLSFSNVKWGEWRYKVMEVEGKVRKKIFF